MKKFISLLLVLSLCIGTVCVLPACSKEEGPTGNTDAPTLLGGWEINDEDVEADMPQYAKDAFDRAMEERSKGMLDGDHYIPLAYLGCQFAGNGVNYAYLCKTAVTDFTLYSSLCVVTVYSGATGSAAMSNVSGVNIADFTENTDLTFDPAPIVGGWTLCADYPAKLSADDQAAFDAATATLAGAKYTPLALMGKQVVAGENLAFLCCAESVTAEPVRALCVVTVYADLEGNFTVTSIAPFSIA